MKSNRAVLCGMLLVCLASASRAFAADVDAEFVKQTQFGVPFQIDSKQIARLGAREVWLFASSDRGATWQHVSTEAPDAGRFAFDVPGDGEYWFAMRTPDARHVLHPQTTTMEPELKVVVDRTAPSLELSLDQVAPGMIRLTWRATDENLQADSLVLESIQSGTERWQPLNFKPEASGQIAWSVPPGARVAVRGRIADRAQNETEQQVQVGPFVEELPPPSLADSQPTAPPGTGPSPRFPDAVASTEPLIGSPSTSSPQVLPAGGLGDEASERNSKPAQEAGTQQDDSTDALRQVVNSRRFHIKYAVDDIADMGIAAVEFYVTEDDGRQWWRYGPDEDRTSPAEIEVPRAATYGFALRIRTAAGIADEPPRPGDKPEIVVVVDETPPTAELLPIQPEMSPGQQRVSIRWNVRDEHPARTPVALSYAAGPQGPWQPIADWQEDRGGYVWNVGGEVPARVLIRLTARDAAGNVTHVQTPSPVVVSRPIPRARVVGVEAVGVRR